MLKADDLDFSTYETENVVFFFFVREMRSMGSILTGESSFEEVKKKAPLSVSLPLALSSSLCESVRSHY